MLERDVEKHLVNRVKAAGGEIRKLKWIGRRGAPDRLVCLPHRCALVELKRPGEQLAPHQRREHARLIACGLTVVTLDSIEAVDVFMAVNHA